MSFPSASFSAEWTYNSDISLGLEYTDNLFFTSSNSLNGEVDDTFALILPAFSILAESETTSNQLDFGVAVERYDKVKEADRNDPYVRYNWDTVQENYRLGLNAGYSQRSTRTSELETTGQVYIFGTQILSTIAPYWQLAVTESNSLRIGANLTSVSYDVDTLVNYENYGLLTNWFYDYSDASTLSINVGFNRYDSADAGVDFDYGSLLVGMDYNASDLLNLTLSLGGGYGVREEGDNYVTGLLNAGLNYRQEYYSISLGVSSSLAPSGQADLRQIHVLTFVYDHQLTENLGFNFNANLSESFPVDDPDAVRNEVFTVRPALSYQIAQDWYFDTWYQYRSNREIGNEVISANTGYLGVRWRPE